MTWAETLTVLGAVTILSVAFGFGKSIGEDLAVEFMDVLERLAEMITGKK